MGKENKSKIIRVAFEEFANAHKGETLTTKAINEGVQELLQAFKLVLAFTG